MRKMPKRSPMLPNMQALWVFVSSICMCKYNNDNISISIEYQLSLSWWAIVQHSINSRGERFKVKGSLSRKIVNFGWKEFSGFNRNRIHEEDQRRWGQFYIIRSTKIGIHSMRKSVLGSFVTDVYNKRSRRGMAN